MNAAQLNDAGNRESTANRNWGRINWDLAEKTENGTQVRIVKVMCGVQPNNCRAVG